MAPSLSRSTSSGRPDGHAHRRKRVPGAAGGGPRSLPVSSKHFHVPGLKSQLELGGDVSCSNSPRPATIKAWSGSRPASRRSGPKSVGFQMGAVRQQLGQESKRHEVSGLSGRKVTLESRARVAGRPLPCCWRCPILFGASEKPKSADCRKSLRASAGSVRRPAEPHVTFSAIQ